MTDLCLDARPRVVSYLAVGALRSSKFRHHGGAAIRQNVRAPGTGAGSGKLGEGGEMPRSRTLSYGTVLEMPRIRVSIVFESGARIGPGKAKLLESIRDTGSISAAARDMGMSYKRAWVLLDSINQAFTEPVTTAAPGGVGGGGAILTAFGVEVLERYRRIQDRTAALSADDLAVLADRARPDAGPKI